MKGNFAADDSNSDSCLLSGQRQNLGKRKGCGEGVQREGGKQLRKEVPPKCLAYLEQPESWCCVDRPLTDGISSAAYSTHLDMKSEVTIRSLFWFI